jgi:hypothetical protein
MGNKEFKHGDKVYWVSRYANSNSLKIERTVDYVLNDKEEVWFTSGTWMPIEQVHHVEEDKAFVFAPGKKVRSKTCHSLVLKVLAENGDYFWGDDGVYMPATYSKIGFEPIPQWVPKVGDFVGSYKIIAIDGNTVWVYDNSWAVKHIDQCNKFKTLEEIIALHELDVNGI